MLEGELVKLRSLEPADVEREHAWINDREVTRYLVSGRYPLSYADEQRWLEQHPPNAFASGVRLAIETKDSVHIGNLELSSTRQEDRKAVLGVMIGDKEYWSNGYGTDAIVTLLRFSFAEMNLHRVWLTVLEFNARAIACYRKCGFEEEARLRDETYKEGAYHDILVMGVLRDEFEAIRGATTPREGETDA